jgi:hypothetical protein
MQQQFDHDRRVSPSFKNAIQHLPCVAFLVRRGIPTDVGEGGAIAIDILVAYAVAKGLNAAQGEKLAQQMAERTARCTDVAQVVRRFRERLVAVQSAGDHWGWDCRRVWASRGFIKRGACTGWSCPHYECASVPALSAEGITRSDADDQRERDVLTYVLNVPEGMDEALRKDVPPGAFGAQYTCRDGTAVLLNRALWHVCRDLAARGHAVQVSTILATLSRVDVMKPLLRETARYLDGVGAETPCPRDTYLKALKQLKEREVRRRGVEALRRAGAALRSDAPLEITLGTLAADVDALKRAAGDDATRLLEDDLADLVQALFTTRRPVMPTPSAWLNDVLGGGWEPGKLYVVCGMSDKADNAATDFSAWCAE